MTRDRLLRWGRVLTFRATTEDFAALNGHDLLLGLAATWIVGMGRYWDDPRALLLQRFGLGSIAYVFVMALLLWVVIWPLGASKWSYTHVLTFVALVAPPAILYAVPIERFASLETSRNVNAWFLAVVAAWRVALLLFFLRRHAAITYPRAIVGALVPLTLIINALVALNLERAVFNLMGGLRGPGTPNDSAYGVLMLITLFADMAFVPVLLAYLVLVAFAFMEKREAG